MKKRRLKRVVFSAELFQDILVWGIVPQLRWTESEIPVDAVIVASTEDPNTLHVNVFVAHDSFREVEEGAAIPEARPPITHTYSLFHILEAATDVLLALEDGSRPDDDDIDRLRTEVIQLEQVLGIG